MSQVERVDLSGRKIVVGVCAGIAAYKVCQLVSDLVASKAEVVVIMTPDALHFVGTATFQGLTGNKVRVDMFDPMVHEKASHVVLGEWADLYVIAPLTASTLAKLATGQADNLVVATYLAARGPVMAAPAMNVRMYAHPAVQEQVAKVKSFGVEMIGPDEGRMACGTPGLGRMSEPETIYRAIVERLNRK